MAISLVAADKYDPITSTASRTVTVPAGVANGDTLICFATKSGGTTGFTLAGGTLTGMSLHKEDSRSGIWSAVYIKENASASDSGKTITLTTTASYRSSVFIAVYRGAALVSVVDVSDSLDGNGSVHNCPAVTSVAGGYVINYMGGVTGATGSQTWTTPSGFTKDIESVDAATSGGASAALFHRDAPIAASTSFPQQAYTPSVTATTYIGWTVILKEKTAATSTVPGSVKSNAGSWVAVGAANQTAAVADSSDTSYIETAGNPSSASIEFNLLETLATGQVRIKVKAQRVDAASGTLVTRLKQGSTVIATWTETLTSTLTEYTYVTTTSQAAAITDPSTLSVEYLGTAA